MIANTRRIYLIRLLVCVLLVLAGKLYADEDSNWVFAASEFESTLESDATARLLPQYILQNFSQNSMRTVSLEEQYRQDAFALERELQELYEKMQLFILERDSLIITHDNDDDRKTLQSEKTEEIESLLQDIQKKESEVSSLSLDNYFFTEKPVTLWKNNSESLYELPKYMEYFAPDDINALITGAIEYADSFIYVTTIVTLYPGAVVQIEIVETDTITAIQDIAQRIAEEIYLALSNKEEVTIRFEVEPKEALSNTTIHIDGAILSTQGSEEKEALFASVPSGIYEFYVEAEGYEGMAITHSFIGEKEFLVSIQLREIPKKDVSFVIPSVVGELFLNTIKMDNSSTLENVKDEKSDTIGVVTINDLPALGEFVDEEGIKTWFLLKSPKNMLLTDSIEAYNFSFKPNTKNFADIIEKNRKRMYNSYAALIVSLPLYFIANGQYLNEYNSWASGNSSGNNISMWETARDVTMGTSIALGINFIAQLGIYIYSANAILPEEVSIKQQ